MASALMRFLLNSRAGKRRQPAELPGRKVSVCESCDGITIWQYDPMQDRMAAHMNDRDEDTGKPWKYCDDCKEAAAGEYQEPGAKRRRRKRGTQA